MNKSLSIIFFIILAVAIVAGGVWYGNRMVTGNQSPVASINTNNNVATSSANNNNMEQTTNGLQIKDLVVGTGTVAVNGDTVNVLYTGTLEDGTVFDASSNHGNQPFSFTLGAGKVIQGWDQGVLGMKVGGKRELVIPPNLGYGAQGAGSVIPPNATLHFTVELLSVGK